jgi:hypothetical protein
MAGLVPPFTSLTPISTKDVDARHKAGREDLFGSQLWRRPLDKTMAGTADSQGSLPKTAAGDYLDDNAAELSLYRGLLPAASL